MALLARRDVYNRTQHQQIYPPDTPSADMSLATADASLMTPVISSECHLINTTTGSIITPAGQYSGEMTSQSAAMMSQMQGTCNNLHHSMTQQQCTEVSSSTNTAPLGVLNGSLVGEFELNEEDLKQCLMGLQQSFMMNPCDVTEHTVMSEFDYVSSNSNNNSNNTYLSRTLPPMTLPHQSMAQDPPTPPFSATSPLLVPNSSDHFNFPQPPTPSDSGDSPYCSPQKIVGNGFAMSNFASSTARRQPPFNGNQFYVMK